MVKRRAKKRYRIERHHIIPKSRGGSGRLENTCRVTKVQHMHYHALFDNRVPSEIIKYLNAKFWNRNYLIEFKAKYQEKYY